MKWNIITDSSCDLNFEAINNNGHQIVVESVPFIISIGEEDFIDNENVSVDDMLQKMEQTKELARTSCPSPSSWLEKVNDDDENIIMITISKELSGSYNSACVAKDMLLEDNPNRNIAIINSFSAGPGLANITKTICDEILNGASFDDVVKMAENTATSQYTLFALSSFDNLVKNGRVNKIVGLLAGKLNFWGIGMATKEGKIAIKDKARGEKKAIRVISDIIQKDMEQLKSVYISHCKNIDMANEIKEIIESVFENIKVEISEAKALCSFYAERHGIIISYV